MGGKSRPSDFPRTQTVRCLRGDHCHQVSAGLFRCRRVEARLARKTSLSDHGERSLSAAALCQDGAPAPRAVPGPHLKRSGRAGAGQEAGAQARDGGLAPADVAGWSSPGRLREEAEPWFGLSWQHRRPSGKAGGGGGGGAGLSGNCSNSNRSRRRHHLHLAPGARPAPARPPLPATLALPTRQVRRRAGARPRGLETPGRVGGGDRLGGSRGGQRGTASLAGWRWSREQRVSCPLGRGRKGRQRPGGGGAPGLALSPAVTPISSRRARLGPMSWWPGACPWGGLQSGGSEGGPGARRPSFHSG